MQKLAYEATSRHKDMIKEALIGALARGAWGLGKWIVKNPGKTLSIGLPALEVGSAAAKGFNSAPTGARIGAQLRGAGLTSQLS